ncbi:adenylate/guanylate cyclase domain-containing protein [Cryptosporangium aurantiacum]|uniref:adenylate/guanylate cyclase domain-containing protein n=1 Tax=Cryptosporangium aurantiacum TaxID=134849 RepID=UPI0015BB9C19|nr:adenylate/guanylate cyclase domain-containing protein [Cryptosporangium aurantiacum]
MPTVLRCSNCGEENNPPQARFCFSCGNALTSDDTRELRKTITVVFTDVVGSSSLGERLDPEVLRRMMTRYYEHATAIHVKHGGRVQKFIGDAVMAVFGLPNSREDDALRAVRAAAELHASLEDLNRTLERDWQVTLNLRTGVNTGEVVIGAAFLGQDITLGDVVNVAARLETAAEPGSVLIGDATYRLSRDAVTAEMLPPMTVRGRGVPVDAWRLLAVKPGASGHARRLDAPIVGRVQELALLQQLFDRAVAERTVQSITVLGSGGSGKSRLLYELLNRVGDRATVLRGQCLSYGDGLTYWPLAEIVRQAAGVGPEEDTAAVRRKLSALLPGDDRTVTALAGLLGEPTGPTILEPPATAASVEDLPEAMFRFASTLAARRPLVLVLDDLHWAEPALLDLILKLAEWLRDSPVLICCLSRPELLEAHPQLSSGGTNTLMLEPLTGDDSAALLDNLLDGAEGAEEVRARIVEAAEGNPLYIEELVGMLLDDGLLDRIDGRWTLTAEINRLAVPPSVGALLAARLDGLPKGERGVLERASVIGDVFYRNGVIALTSPDQRRDVTGALLSLVRKELLRPEGSVLHGESALRFRHQLVRDAAYNSLSKRERAHLHEAAGRWMEETLAGRLPELEEIVGYHLEQAARYRSGIGPADPDTLELSRRAAEHLGRAGRRAFARRDMPAAITLLGRATALLPAEHPGRVGLLPQFAAALVERGEFARASELLTEAAMAADRTGDNELRRETEKVRSVLRLLSGPSTDDLADGGVSPARAGERQPLPDLTTTVELGGGGGASVAASWTLLRDVRWLPRAVNSVDRPPTDADSSGAGPGADGRRQAIAKAFALAAVLGDAPVEQTISQYRAELASVSTNRTAEVRLRGALAGLTAMAGRFDDAREHLVAAQAITDRLGLRVRAVSLAYLGGYVEMLAGDPAAAAAKLHAGAEECAQMGERYVLSNLLALLAQARYAQGVLAESAQLASDAERAAPNDEIVAQATARAARGKALARLGRVEQAVTAARSAVDTVRGTGLSTVEADVLLDLAEVLELLGDPIGARMSASESLDRYERKGNVISGARARAVVLRLGG